MSDFHEDPNHTRYFIAFTTVTGDLGNTDLNLRHPIRGGDDVKAVEVLIEESVGVQVSVRNFRRFDSD